MIPICKGTQDTQDILISDSKRRINSPIDTDIQDCITDECCLVLPSSGKSLAGPTIRLCMGPHPHAWTTRKLSSSWQRLDELLSSKWKVRIQAPPTVFNLIIFTCRHGIFSLAVSLRTRCRAPIFAYPRVAAASLRCLIAVPASAISFFDLCVLGRSCIAAA